MMKLSLMNRVMATMDGEHRSPVVDAIAAPWGPDAGSVRFWRASANFVCVLRIAGVRHFLRFNEISERDPVLVQDEMALLTFLLERGLPVNVPVKSRGGNYVEVVTTESGTFAAVVFEALAGSEVELDDMSDEQLSNWGAAMGRLHRELKTAPADLAPHRPAWPDILAFSREFVRSEEAEVQHEFAEVAELLQSLPQTIADYGLIHFDFESDNLCWDDSGISALDFDDCARLWYAADIAYALRDVWKGGAVDFADRRFVAFVEGYRREECLDDRILQQLPLFIRLHRLFFIGRLRRAVDIVDRATVPDWMQLLCDKLSAGVERYIADIHSGETIVR